MTEIKDDWSTGLFTHETSEGTAQKNATALGRLNAIEDVLNLMKGDSDV